MLQIVGAEYFSTLGLRMLRGREFSRQEEAADPRASRLAIIDEPLARRVFGTDDPLGRQILVGERAQSVLRSVEIIGVAPGLRHHPLDPEPVTHLYFPYGGAYRSLINVHVRVAPGVPEQAMLQTIGRELRQTDARLPIISLRTMAGQRDASVQTWAVRTAASLFSAFGILALALAAIGIYGLQAYDVSRRTREIGIRMALGARAADVAIMILRGGARTVAWGLAIGLLAAAGVGKLVSGLLFGAQPYDPLILTVAAFILTTATLVACLVPARRATRVQPLDALRAE